MVGCFVVCVFIYLIYDTNTEYVNDFGVFCSRKNKFKYIYIISIAGVGYKFIVDYDYYNEI